MSNDATMNSAETEKRTPFREAGMTFQFPIAFAIQHTAVNGEVSGPFTMETLNYHFKGACFRISEHFKLELKKLLESKGSWSATVTLGKRVVHASLPFRICWNRIDADDVMGVEFIETLDEHRLRAPRFKTRNHFSANLSCPDPFDVNREVYFKVLDLSDTGMLLSCSLTNKHLVTGMILENCSFSIPGQLLKNAVTVRIANARVNEKNPTTILLGCAIEMQSEEHAKMIESYISVFGVVEDEKDPNRIEANRIEAISKNQLISKKLKQGLTYRVISQESEYNQVLKLRWQGYVLAGKVLPGLNWKSQGEGVQNEGTILGAWMGGQLVGSVEFRFYGEGKPLRTLRYFNVDSWIAATPDQRLVEINKLVVHPSAQGTDIVLGLIQKIHSILVTRGGFDIIVSATEDLLPLYEKIGFRKTGVTTPHPANPTRVLNLIILKREAYLSAHGMNPYAWSIVYEATQRHMELLGLAKPLRLGFVKKVQQKLSKALSQLGRKKKTRVHAPLINPHLNRVRVDINPKWTEQHYLSSVVKPYILEADRMIGAAPTEAILERLGLNRAYFEGDGNWVSVAFLDAFVEEFRKLGDVAELSRAAGRRSLKPDVFGMKYYFIKHVLTPTTFFKAFEVNLPEFNRTRTYHMTEMGPGRVELKIGLKSPAMLPKHRESCLNWEENLVEVLRLMTGKGAKIFKTACCYEDSDHCAYQLQWNTKQRLVPIALRTTGIAIAGLIVFLGLHQTVGSKAALGIVGAALGCAIAWFRGREIQRLHNHFQKFENASNERYSDLQYTKDQLMHRLEELLLIEESNRSVLKNDSLQGIFDTCLEAICTRFHFSRSIIMLADESRDKLLVAAIKGLDSAKSQDIWKFKVQIKERRDNPLVISSVFLSGNPVVINDVKSHLPLLNEGSRKIIAALGIDGFAIVPIPSDKNTWGVIVAEKGAEMLSIEDNDLKLLERVAIQMGIVLDKQHQLENERKKTALFQKFVPAYAKNDLLKADAEVGLGFQIKDTIAMFIDIRNYTAVTESLAPQAISRLVNGFYGLVERCVRPHNGYVDKFIGDAALVTWGYLDALPENASYLAIQCALNIQNELKTLNETLKEAGIPAIELSVGIDRGQAVCGLFGSDARMEFTGIGPTLNRASRLQGLCRDLDSAFVASSELMQGVDLPLESAELTIKGFKEIQKVYFRRLDSKSKKEQAA